MDWGMLKNPSDAFTVCRNPVSSLANGNEPCSAVPARNHLEHQAGVARLLSPTSSSCWHSLLRPRLGYGVGISVFILVADVLLRFSWILRFSYKLFPFGDALVFECLEVIRRALWNLLRMEWEELKQSGQSIPAPVPDELIVAT